MNTWTTGWPQWSPPMDGGTTRGTESRGHHNERPQWSPPMDGGTTFSAKSCTWPQVAPQWSPPMDGGTTHRRRRQGGHHGHAAMEPADGRRDDLVLAYLPVPERLAAMEPAD